MKIAAITDDGKTISQHFGRAAYYLVATVENGQIVDREMREKLGHSHFSNEPHEAGTPDQPHGFGPTRFLKDEYIETFRTCFRQNDSLYLLPIYYAGGTAQKDISSDNIIAGLGNVAFHAQAIKDREELMTRLQADARSGDCVLLMGARDPSLPAVVRRIVELFGG